MKSFSENTKEAYYDFKLYKVAHYLKMLFVILFIIFEEILWNKIGLPVYNTVKSLVIMTRFKNWITSIEHKYLLLVIFIAPVVVDVVLTWLFGVAMTHAMIFTAIGIYVLKAFMSVLMVIIFNIGKKRLTSIFVIRYSYAVILNFKRTTTFREVKKFSKRLKVKFDIFKDEYLDSTSGNFTESFKKLYTSLKSK